jgi:hypothetical protein
MDLKPTESKTLPEGEVVALKEDEKVSVEKVEPDLKYEASTAQEDIEQKRISGPIVLSPGYDTPMRQSEDWYSLEFFEMGLNNVPYYRIKGLDFPSFSSELEYRLAYLAKVQETSMNVGPMSFRGNMANPLLAKVPVGGMNLSMLLQDQTIIDAPEMQLAFSRLLTSQSDAANGDRTKRIMIMPLALPTAFGRFFRSVSRVMFDVSHGMAYRVYPEGTPLNQTLLGKYRLFINSSVSGFSAAPFDQYVSADRYLFRDTRFYGTLRGIMELAYYGKKLDSILYRRVESSVTVSISPDAEKSALTAVSASYQSTTRTSDFVNLLSVDELGSRTLIQTVAHCLCNNRFSMIYVPFVRDMKTDDFIHTLLLWTMLPGQVMFQETRQNIIWSCIQYLVSRRVFHDADFEIGPDLVDDRLSTVYLPSNFVLKGSHTGAEVAGLRNAFRDFFARPGPVINGISTSNRQPSPAYASDFMVDCSQSSLYIGGAPVLMDTQYAVAEHFSTLMNALSRFLPREFTNAYNMITAVMPSGINSSLRNYAYFLDVRTAIMVKGGFYYNDPLSLDPDLYPRMIESRRRCIPVKPSGSLCALAFVDFKKHDKAIEVPNLGTRVIAHQLDLFRHAFTYIRTQIGNVDIAVFKRRQILEHAFKASGLPMIWKEILMPMASEDTGAGAEMTQLYSWLKDNPLQIEFYSRLESASRRLISDTLIDRGVVSQFVCASFSSIVHEEREGLIQLKSDAFTNAVTERHLRAALQNPERFANAIFQAQRSGGFYVNLHAMIEEHKYEEVYSGNFNSKSPVDTVYRNHDPGVDGKIPVFFSSDRAKTMKSVLENLMMVPPGYFATELPIHRFRSEDFQLFNILTVDWRNVSLPPYDSVRLIQTGRQTLQ